MKQEDLSKVQPIYDFFSKLFPSGYTTDHWLIENDTTLSYAFVVDSGTRRVVLQVYRAFWNDHKISQIIALLQSYQAVCLECLQKDEDKVLSIPEYHK